jgi:hypothetical protein
MANMKRLKGLRALVTDAVEQTTSAVERVHRATAARPFDVLDQVPPVAPGARGVRLIHDATVAGVYETIRQVNRLVGDTISLVIDVAEKATEDGDAGHGPAYDGKSGEHEPHRIRAELAPADEAPKLESGEPALELPEHKPE